MTICMVISLPKIPCIHRNTYKCMVLANPTHMTVYLAISLLIFIWPTLHIVVLTVAKFIYGSGQPYI